MIQRYDFNLTDEPDKNGFQPFMSACILGGVPVLKRRRRRPISASFPVSSVAANMPSGPPSRTHSPTMVRPFK